MLNYIGNVTVNGFPGVDKKTKPIFKQPHKPPLMDPRNTNTGTKQILDDMVQKGIDGSMHKKMCL